MVKNKTPLSDNSDVYGVLAVFVPIVLIVSGLMAAITYAFISDMIPVQ